MAGQIAKLELTWRVRARLYPESQTHRDYLDFVVDGQSLADSFHEVDKGTARDLIGALGWATNKDYERGLVRQLLVEQPPELESGRCLLYVCPECGDIGCGAVTALITADNGNVTWERFRYENDWEEDMWNEAWYRSIGPFRFDKRQYRERLLNPPPKELSV